MQDEDANDDLKDRLVSWFDHEGCFDMSRRIAFVPEDILKQLLGKTVEQAERILDAAGY